MREVGLQANKNRDIPLSNYIQRTKLWKSDKEELLIMTFDDIAMNTAMIELARIRYYCP